MTYPKTVPSGLDPHEETEAYRTLTESERKRDWRRIVGTAGGLLLGAVFLVAAAGKATSLAAFTEQIRLEGLDLLLSARTVALAALALETGLGMALLLGIRYLWLLVPTGLLASCFVFLTGRHYWLVLNELRSESESCGCFGDWIERTPAEAFWQDLLFLVPPLILSFWGRPRGPRSLPHLRLGLAAGAALGVIIFALNAPVAPISPEKQIAPTSALRDFRQTTDYLLVVDGQATREAEIYQSEQSATFLLLAPMLRSALVLRLQTSGIEKVDVGKIARRNDGQIDLLPDTTFQTAGRFRVLASGVTFSVDGRQFSLQNRSSP